MSYIIHSYRVTREVNDLVEGWLKGLNQETRHFFAHVLFYSVNHRPEQGEYCPVPGKLMQKTWGTKCQVFWEVLVARELIEVKELENGKTFSATKGMEVCRQFKVVDSKVAEFLKVEAESLGKESIITVNLVNGRKMIKYARNEIKNPTTGTAIPKLVKDSMQAIEKCVINLDEMNFYLETLEEAASTGSSRAQKVARINRAAVNTVKKSNLKKLDNGLAEYEPSYKMQSTGRITEQGVGLQNCTREMKDKAFKGIPGLINYDLKSSQVWGLIQWFEEAGLETSWLIEYLGRDKQEYADAVGISKDCWKKCFMALIMGGRGLDDKELDRLEAAETDEEVKNALTHKISEYLLEEAEGHIDRMVGLHGNFAKVTEELQEQLTKWHQWLIEVHPTKMGVSAVNQHGTYLTNGCGVSFVISKWKDSKGKWINKKQLGMKLAAFWLQGTEAAFIHHLTVVSGHYGYKVLNNQHDGLVTLGAIPEEAVEYARIHSGLKYASLEVKSFL